MSNETVQIKKLLWVGPLTVVASILGVLIVRIIAVALLRPNPQPMSLGWGAPIIFTTVLCSGAVLVFALVAKFAKKPVRTYQIIALVALLLSFLPDFAYAGSGMPGASWPVAIALMIMHVVAWAITVQVLIRGTTVNP
jgi:hypothetical protein